MIRSAGRSKLQGRAGRLLDINVLARAWPELPSATQQQMMEQAGLQTGLIYADTSRDEREACVLTPSVDTLGSLARQEAAAPASTMLLSGA